MGIRLWAALKQWWSGRPGGARHMGSIVIFSTGTPPGVERVKSFAAKHRRSIAWWVMLAVATGFIGWAVVVVMKNLTGLG
jgi:hypothetical protein